MCITNRVCGDPESLFTSRLHFTILPDDGILSGKMKPFPNYTAPGYA